MRPFILITNDDSIDSPGLHAAAEALMPIADILIAAPAKQQSAAGRSLWAAPKAVFQKRSIDIAGQKINGWCLDASPATTVHYALQCLVTEKKPDMVVSGINFGENIGTNVTASGTVGAAIQSAVWDYKSLAVSLEVPQEYHYKHGEVDWNGAIGILQKAVQNLLYSEWPEDVHILKIDIPDIADETTPWQISRQSREPGWWTKVSNPSPNSVAGTTLAKRGPRPGYQWQTDDDMGVLLERREVAITPLSINLTSRVDLKHVEALFHNH